jgi:hypothetical protein
MLYSLITSLNEEIASGLTFDEYRAILPEMEKYYARPEKGISVHVIQDFESMKGEK